MAHLLRSNTQMSWDIVAIEADVEFLCGLVLKHPGQTRTQQRRVFGLRAVPEWHAGRQAQGDVPALH